MTLNVGDVKNLLDVNGCSRRHVLSRLPSRIVFLYFDQLIDGPVIGDSSALRSHIVAELVVFLQHLPADVELDVVEGDLAGLLGDGVHVVVRQDLEELMGQGLNTGQSFADWLSDLPDYLLFSILDTLLFLIN